MSYFKYFLLLLSIGSRFLSLSAQTIEGLVKTDGGRPIAGVLISDGHSFVTTDQKGYYRIDTAPNATTVYIHQNSGYLVNPFYYLLKPEQSNYDFTIEKSPENGNETVNVLVIGDPETDDISYMKEIAEYIEQFPEIDFVLIAGDICERNGMRAHSKMLTRESFPRPVYYVIGNHDIVNLAPGETDFYAANVAPWYYSFDYKGILFVAAPMYNAWGPPLPYDMKEYGDWLKKLLSIFPPSQPKVLMTHDIIDLVGHIVPTHDKPIILDDYNFRAILYGHKHMNVVMHYDSGRKALSTATTNFGGVGLSAPNFRVITIAKDSTIRSTLHYTKLKELLNAGTDGRQLWVTAGNSGDEVIRVVVTGRDGTEQPLNQMTSLGWHAPLPFGEWKPVMARATTKSGRSFSVEVKNSDCQLLQALPQETAMADLLIDGDFLFVAVTDDAEAEYGGVYAIDRYSGERKWFYQTQYSVRNNMTQSRDRLYLIDTRGNILSLNKSDGSVVWNNSANLKTINPSASGVILVDNVVVGGYGALLRGIDSVTGKTLWENKIWTERTPVEDKLATKGNVVYVISALNGLYAYEAHTGEILWRFNKNYLSGTVCVGEEELFVKGEEEFFKLNSKDGAILINKPLIGLASASAPILWEDLVIFGTGSQGIIALKQEDLSEVWNFLPNKTLITTTRYEKGTPPTVDATVMVDGDVLEVGAGDGFIYRLDAATGKMLNRHFLGAPIVSKGVKAKDGRKYFNDITGRVFQLSH